MPRRSSIKAVRDQRFSTELPDETNLRLASRRTCDHVSGCNQTSEGSDL